MQEYPFSKLKVSPLFLVLLVLLLYCYLAFLPSPQPIETNLDPSWRYGISKASIEGLIFGKDIVFTYGPLSYLIDGASLKENILSITIFRLLVHSILFTLVIIKLIRLKANLQKISLTLSILFAYLIGSCVAKGHPLLFKPDYQIIVIFLIILSFDDFIRNSPRLSATVLGGLAGFCLLNKFSLGITILGSLVLYLLGNLYSAIKNNSKIVPSGLAVIDGIVAAISVSFILLYPADFISNLFKITIGLLFSSLIIWIYSKKLSAWGAFYIIYIPLMLIIVAYSEPSLFDFLKNSWEISSGYASGMSIVELQRSLLMGISEIILVIVVAILLVKQNNISFALAILWILFITFKHSFIRQDEAHMPFLFMISTFLVSLSIPMLKNTKLEKMSYLIHFCLLLLAILIFNNLFYSPLNIRSLDEESDKLLSPVHIVDRVRNIFNFESVFEKSTNNLSQLKLPNKITSLVKDQEIDIVPWELSLVPANQLNWKPRPIFQSYSAYTVALDNLNFQSLSEKPREYIFYNFTSIDQRHPFFDEPKTFAYLFCNYQPSSTVASFIDTEELKNIILLEKRQSSRCLPSTLISTVSIPWKKNQFINVSDKSVIFANIQFEYSIWGKIYKAIFRAAAVTMQVNYLDGSQMQYRIIPENSENGVLISHLPRDDQEAMAFWQGNLPAPVKSFSFEAVNSFLYKPNIKMLLRNERLKT